jgi:hypothetical protein
VVTPGELPNLEAMFVGSNQTCGTSYDEFGQMQLGCWHYIEAMDVFVYDFITQIGEEDLIFDDDIAFLSIGEPTIGIQENGKIFVFNGLSELNISGSQINPVTETPYDTTLNSLIWIPTEEN